MTRFTVAAFFVVGACHSQPDSVTIQPAPVTSTNASAIPQTPAPKKRICEPTISCGFWSKCQWLEIDHLEPTYEVYRIAGSDAGGYGSLYWRWHHCWPEDAGPSGCARYCDATGACVDGLESNGVCTVSHPPTPSPYVCEVHGDECVTKTK